MHWAWLSSLAIQRKWRAQKPRKRVRWRLVLPVGCTIIRAICRTADKGNSSRPKRIPRLISLKVSDWSIFPDGFSASRNQKARTDLAIFEYCTVSGLSPSRFLHEFISPEACSSRETEQLISVSFAWTTSAIVRCCLNKIKHAYHLNLKYLFSYSRRLRSITVRTFDYAAEWETLAFPSGDVAREVEDHRFNFLNANHFEALRQTGLRKNFQPGSDFLEVCNENALSDESGKSFQGVCLPRKGANMMVLLHGIN